MKMFIQWLGGTADAGHNTFLVCLPTQRVMFGAAEGTQRVCAEHSIRISGSTASTAAGSTTPVSSRLSSIWLASLDWKHIGGLPGLLCTIADAGSRGVRLFGPRGLRSVICAMRPFLQRDAFAVEVVELVDDGAWIVDGDIKVKALLSKTATRTQRTDQAAQYEWESRILSKMFPSSSRKERISLREDATASDIPSTDTPPEAPLKQVSGLAGFLVSGPRKPGKFDVEAAKRLGIPAGPLFGRLQRGEPVTWNGRLIEPEECVAAASSAPAFLYLHERLADCSKSAVEALLEPEQALIGIIHDYPDPTPIEGCLNMAYARGDGSLEPVLVGSFLQSVERSLADPSMYCAPLSCKAEYHDSRFESIRPLCKLHLAPTIELEQHPIVLPEHIAATLYAQPTPAGRTAGMVTFLGTGACIPGKYRNVSSIHVDIAGGILLDCGEGTAGQLKRMGLKNPRVICITHMHADHHLGTLSLLDDASTVIIGPSRFGDWISEISGREFAFVACDAIVDGFYEIAGHTRISAVRVDHCHDAFGFRLEHEGKTLVYSGDTRPCDSITRAAREATLLIHECTMADDLLHEAIDRKHTAFSEALDVVRKSNAQRSVLTHFSQRYAKGIDTTSEQDRNLSELNVRLAVDFMHVPFA